jgi:hypothetical protein
MLNNYHRPAPPTTLSRAFDVSQNAFYQRAPSILLSQPQDARKRTPARIFNPENGIQFADLHRRMHDPEVRMHARGLHKTIFRVKIKRWIFVVDSGFWRCRLLFLSTSHLPARAGRQPSPM